MTVNSALESLAAFALAFMVGVLACIGLRLYIQIVKSEAIAVHRS